MLFVTAKKSWQSIVSELAAEDGFTIHAACNSKFIHEWLIAEGF